MALRKMEMQVELSLYDRDEYKTLASAKANLSISDPQMLYYALDADHNQFGEVCRFLVTDLISQINEEAANEKDREEGDHS